MAPREIKPSSIPAKNRAPFGPEPEAPKPRRQPSPKPRLTAASGAGAGAAAGPEGAALGAAAGLGAGAARDAGRARIPTGNRQYQGVILAEFLVAVLIVALAPVARGKPASGKSSGPSPYGVDDVKQLVGVGAVYFILALLSSGKYGRLSAWLGGLILVAIGLAQQQSGGLAGIFGIFQPSSKSAGAGDGSVGSPFTPGIGQQIQQQAQNQFSQVPNATGSFPTIGPKLGFVDPNIPEQIQGQVEQQFNTGQTAVVTQDQATGGFQVA